MDVLRYGHAGLRHLRRKPRSEVTQKEAINTTRR